MVSALPGPFRLLEQEIHDCRRCPRLRAWCEQVTRVKRRAYLGQTYCGKPVAGFGDPDARMLVLGLAPGAHGANRTGRVFTGDRSGDWLCRALYQTGFANQPQSMHIGDGLVLHDAWISASVRCAPPDNKPSREETANCRKYLERELALLKNLRLVVALGRLAFDNYLSLMCGRGAIQSRAGFVFEHNRVHCLHTGLPVLLSSYHPSQQNTSTGKLTEPMLRAVFEQAAALLNAPEQLCRTLLNSAIPSSTG
jgi:uracil-DNA glycosylase family 4